jgi:hypothetical protein
VHAARCHWADSPSSRPFDEVSSVQEMGATSPLRMPLSHARGSVPEREDDRAGRKIATDTIARLCEKDDQLWNEASGLITSGLPLGYTHGPAALTGSLFRIIRYSGRPAFRKRGGLPC